jgi:segregation and condensation protein A
MSDLAIQLPLYEGPFEPLLALIRRGQYSVADIPIPIARIARQFSAYIARAEDLDLELGAEFVEAAAWLIYLKSLSLLPKTEASSDATQREVPLTTEQLEWALEFLRTQLAQLGWHQQASEVPSFETVPPESGKVQTGPPTIQDVIEAARNALETAQAQSRLPLAEPDRFTVEDRLAWIRRQLEGADRTRPISTAPWFRQQPTDGARIALFLALLELPRKSPFRLWQLREFGEIYLQCR